MRIDLRFLKEFVNIDLPLREVKELLASLGIEVAEVHQDHESVSMDVEITPNRPDWLSHLGVAREIHARMPSVPLIIPYGDDADVEMGEEGEAVEVRIESAADCRRYSGCILHQIKPEPSPPEVCRLLESLGMRPINQVVDASNIVLMAIGHPLHMFDLERLEGRQIRVRRALPGEDLRLLDGRVAQLTPEDLVIADENRPVALAGVMGGADSGINENTRSVFIESAWFDPVRVRLTARRLGLQTEASYRFERGADISATPTALRMALKLIRKWSGMDVIASGFRDEYPGASRLKQVRMPADFPGRYTGIDIQPQEAARILERLGFQVDTSEADSWTVTVPSYRVDVDCKQDLVEEITRVYGYDRIPAKMPRTVNLTINPAPLRDLRLDAGRHLIANGYYQALNYSFHSLEDNQMMADGNADATDFISLRNPLGRDYAILRNSLIPGLVRATVLNANQGAATIKLYETGKRFFHGPDKKFCEQETLAATAWGEHESLSWRNTRAVPIDFFVFRGEMEALLQRLGSPFTIKSNALPWLRPGCSFSVQIHNRPEGWMGCMKQEIVDAAGINGEIAAMEIHLEPFIRERRVQRFVQWNRLPMVKRDLSVYVPREVRYADLEQAIAAQRPRELESYHLFDYYRDQTDPGKEKISMAMSFYYRHANQTLTGEEVNRIHQELVDHLVKLLQLEPRT
ncbi:MAG: phenylalanine--tRNA ligase subunit beta [Acidobacteriota bacterium]|jgi:phenylalanyl-tRNA synthetase beta chain|nr:phenylalanine--tRNA ligase subunit beta [Acidobacteriota bacterium]